MARDDYHDRLEQKRERYAELAAKNEREAEARFDSQNIRNVRGMMGQPILIGHHSERAHRAILKRADNDMRKGSEAYQRSKYYKSKALSVGSGGISSDNPDALDELCEKLSVLENDRAHYKRVNAAWRKAGKPEPDNQDAWRAIADATELSPGPLHSIRMDMARDILSREPFPRYKLTNIGARIRATKLRIAELEALASREERAPLIGEGFEVVEDAEINRLCFEFPSKPSDKVRSRLKAEGWRWNKTRLAWTRLLNDAAWYSAERLAAVI